MNTTIKNVISWNLLEGVECPEMRIDSSQKRHSLFFNAWELYSNGDDSVSSSLSEICHVVHALNRLQRITIDATHKVRIRHGYVTYYVTTNVPDWLVEKFIDDSYKHKVVLVYEAGFFN